MPIITVVGVHPAVDGAYTLDFDDAFTGNELHLIKQHAGVRVGEIGDAMEAGDYDLIIALAKIAADRSGKDIPIKTLMGAKVGAITFEQTDAEKAADAEDDELPPVSAPGGATGDGSSRTGSGSSSSNGSDAAPESVLPGIGVLG